MRAFRRRSKTTIMIYHIDNRASASRARRMGNDPLSLRKQPPSNPPPQDDSGDRAETACTEGDSCTHRLS